VLNVERAPSSSVLGVLVEGLTDGDFTHLDAQEATHLPRETVMVEPRGGGPVLAQIYWLRQGNHKGGPSPRYQAVVSNGPGRWGRPFTRTCARPRWIRRGSRSSWPDRPAGAMLCR